MEQNKKYVKYLNDNKWTTYLAYELKKNNQSNSADMLIKYEALLSQCSYLSRLAYSSAGIFCRMVKHLDITPNAFNNYIRVIEKIYQKLFNFKCSYNSKYIQDSPEYQKYFNPDPNPIPNNKTTTPIGFFVQNKKKLNVYFYVHYNPDSKFNNIKTLYISFKGSSNITDFIHDLKSAVFPDKLLSSLNGWGNTHQQENDGKAGAGFINILVESIPDLCSKIEILKGHNFERIILTGHSLGGTLASLFGYYIKKYKPDITDKPIHIITFGACCLFDAIGRNNFNEFLSIESNGKTPFTLDRVTTNFDPVIVLPTDLDHPGYTLLRTEIKAYSKTGRTNEIGELRKMMGVMNGYFDNDLLLSQNFVDLFTNSADFYKNGQYDMELYRSKYRIKFATNAKEQWPILKKALPDAKETIKELFNQIETSTKKLNNIQNGGIEFKRPIAKATNAYKSKTQNMMPNEIKYGCYKTMTAGFCHASYMGVSYITVLRLQGADSDYTLYNQGNQIISINTNTNIKNCRTNNKNKPRNSQKQITTVAATTITATTIATPPQPPTTTTNATPTTPPTTTTTTNTATTTNAGPPVNTSVKKNNKNGQKSQCSIL